MFNYLNDLPSHNHTIILLGDFNFPDIDWNLPTGHSFYSNQFCDLIFQYNLTQFVTFPTHVMENILDLVLSDNIDLISDISSNSSHDSLLTSDHFVISFSVSSSQPKQSSGSGSRYIMDCSHADWMGLTSYLLEYDFSSLYSINDLDLLWFQLKKDTQVTQLDSSYLGSKLKTLVTHNGLPLKSDMTKLNPSIR